MWTSIEERARDVADALATCIVGLDPVFLKRKRRRMLPWDTDPDCCECRVVDVVVARDIVMTPSVSEERDLCDRIHQKKKTTR